MMSVLRKTVNGLRQNTALATKTNLEFRLYVSRTVVPEVSPKTEQTIKRET